MGADTARYTTVVAQTTTGKTVHVVRDFMLTQHSDTHRTACGRTITGPTQAQGRDAVNCRRCRPAY